MYAYSLHLYVKHIYKVNFVHTRFRRICFFEETLSIDYNTGNRAKTAGSGWKRMGDNTFFVEAIMRSAIHY